MISNPNSSKNPTRLSSFFSALLTTCNTIFLIFVETSCCFSLLILRSFSRYSYFHYRVSAQGLKEESTENRAMLQIDSSFISLYPGHFFWIALFVRCMTLSNSCTSNITIKNIIGFLHKALDYLSYILSAKVERIHHSRIQGMVLLRL